MILAAILLSSGSAFAWRIGIVPPPLWVGPPGFYYPGYYPPPVYYGPGYYSSPYRVWGLGSGPLGSDMDSLRSGKDLDSGLLGISVINERD